MSVVVASLISFVATSGLITTSTCLCTVNSYFICVVVRGHIALVYVNHVLDLDLALDYDLLHGTEIIVHFVIISGCDLEFR